MTDLDFSEPIILSDNQQNSIVVDGIDVDQPVIGNYGLILDDSDETKTSFFIKLKRVSLDVNRNLQTALTPQNTNAEIELNINCASALKDIFNFTVKTFPNYGPYGYVNYKKGELAAYKYGMTLNNTRGGGNIFNANK